eukprot:COSAG05_NODE_933_length_6538_cov_16.519646_8_plen_199_part_00
MAGVLGGFMQMAAQQQQQQQQQMLMMQMQMPMQSPIGVLPPTFSPAYPPPQMPGTGLMQHAGPLGGGAVPLHAGPMGECAGSVHILRLLVAVPAPHTHAHTHIHRVLARSLARSLSLSLARLFLSLVTAPTYHAYSRLHQCKLVCSPATTTLHLPCNICVVSQYWVCALAQALLEVSVLRTCTPQGLGPFKVAPWRQR